MKRIAITLVVVAASCGLAYYVLTHPGIDRVERLESEYQSLKEKNERLARKNERLRKTIVGLRDDPRLAERQARDRAGLARPDEVVVQFAEEEGAREFEVELDVRPHAIRLASEELGIEELDERLEEMNETLPGAGLTVEIDGEVGPLRRERVLDIVDRSSVASPGVRTAEK